MRLSYHPTRWLDLGISRTALYGGKGRETYDTPRDWWELLTAVHENVDPGDNERYDNDQYVAVDVTVRLPLLNGLGPLRGGRIYWEYGATDIISRWQGENTGKWEPFQMNRVANLGGLYLSTALTDLRFEFAETDPSWYRNGQYPQGYTYRGRPLGHPMGRTPGAGTSRSPGTWPGDGRQRPPWICRSGGGASPPRSTGPSGA